MTQFKLEEHEITSPVWQKIKAHYKARLEAQRAANDFDAPEQKTARRRGRIDEIKLLLSIETPEQVGEE